MKRALVVFVLATAVHAGGTDQVGDRFRDQLGKRIQNARLSEARDFFGALTGDFSARVATGQSIITDQGVTMTFSRNSTRFCERADGTLATLTANQPCVETLGFVAEGNNLQKQLRSKDFENAYWECTNATVTANTHAAPDGTTTADTLTSTVAGGYCESGTWLHAGVPATLSLYARSVSGTQSWTLQSWDDIAGVARCSTTTTATTTWPTWKTRAACIVTSTTLANDHTFRIYPGGTSGTGSIVVWAANRMDSHRGLVYPILADGSQVLKAWDNLRYVPDKDISARGCIAATITFSSSPGHMVFSSGVISGGIGGANLPIQMNGLTAVRFYDGTNVNSVTIPDVTGRTINVRTVWGISGKSQIVADGVTGTQHTFDGSLAASTIYFGAQDNSGSPIQAVLKNLRLGTSATRGCQ